MPSQKRNLKITKQDRNKKNFNNIKAAEKEKKVTIKKEERLTCELKRFGLKERRDFTKDLITKEDYNKIKEFNRNDIFIRKADKNNTFVKMDKNEYIQQLTYLLSNTSKFQKFNSDPTEAIKRKLNSLIAKANKHSTIFSEITGHYEAGYIYGNPKTYKDKNNPPLRPIVSQVGTVTYDVAKRLNALIAPFMQKRYMIESTQEFIEIVKTVKQPKLLASLDVESLFTNVPINETLIIIDAVYNHPDLPPPSFSQDILRDLLLICTTETPFRAPDKSIYQQIDGVSMGTPLGPMVANFYMCHLENNCFQNCPQIKPPTYCRYIDDIFVVIDNFKQLENSKSYFDEHSKLSFTYEIESCKEFSFLDTILRRNKEQLRSAVYRKPTNIGECLNYNSICPNKYKTEVIKNFLHKAYNICFDYISLTTAIARIKQLLINKNFPNYLVDQVT